MTPEEQQAADTANAKADADAIKAKIEELKKAGVKLYSDEEMKEAIARRQEALEKLREKEEKEKKETDEKAKAEGKFSELLNQKESELAALKKQHEEADKKVKLFEEKQKVLRDQTLAKITDQDLRKVAEDIQDVDKLMVFVEKTTNQKVSGAPKHQLGQPDWEFFTREQVQAMSQSEVSANLEKVNKSMTHWVK